MKVIVVLKMKLKVTLRVTMKVIMRVIMRVKKTNITTRWDNWFETIDQTKSLEDQIELLKERGEFLSEYWYVKYYHDNKELNYKIFKAAYLLIDLDDQLFKRIFGYTFAALVDKLINTVDKEKKSKNCWWY